MYYSQESLDEALTSEGYQKIERKPWNVHEGDVIVLEDSTQYRIGTTYIPVRVTSLDHYADFWRDTFTHKTSRKTFRFYHQPLNEADRKHMYHWWSTQARSTDTVDLYRKLPNPTKTA